VRDQLAPGQGDEPSSSVRRKGCPLALDIQRLLGSDAAIELVALSQQGKVSADGTGVSMIVGDASSDQLLQCFERLERLSRVLLANALGLGVPGETYR
jgi:hypothetical protein